MPRGAEGSLLRGAGQQQRRWWLCGCRCQAGSDQTGLACLLACLLLPQKASITNTGDTCSSSNQRDRPAGTGSRSGFVEVLAEILARQVITKPSPHPPSPPPTHISAQHPPTHPPTRRSMCPRRAATPGSHSWQIVTSPSPPTHLQERDPQEGSHPGDRQVVVKGLVDGQGLHNRGRQGDACHCGSRGNTGRVNSEGMHIVGGRAECPPGRCQPQDMSENAVSVCRQGVRGPGGRVA